jgi:RNA polymerase sigma-70 factor, ECF subfamily
VTSATPSSTGSVGVLPALAPDVARTLRAGLRLMALRALGDVESAEEVAQETLARVVTALGGPKATEIRDLGAFAHGVARHVITDARRARHRLLNTESLDGVPDPASLEDPLSKAVNDQERDSVRAALRRLSTTDQQILHLSFYEGLTPSELAARLGVPALRIRKRKSRALERLRRAFLEAAGHDDAPTSTEDREHTRTAPREPGEVA